MYPFHSFVFLVNINKFFRRYYQGNLIEKLVFSKIKIFLIFYILNYLNINNINIIYIYIYIYISLFLYYKYYIYKKKNK